MKKPVHFGIRITEVDGMAVHDSLLANSLELPDKADFEDKTYFEAVIVDAANKTNQRLQTPLVTGGQRRTQLNNLLREINTSILQYWDRVTPKVNGSVILAPNGHRISGK